MKTCVVSPKGREVFIGDGLPTVIIGERINPFGKGPLKEAMKAGDMGPIRQEALKQVKDGADILMISVAAFGIDETVILPKATEAVMETVDVPLCLESRNPVALETTLALGCGKPIISSVTGENDEMDQIFPIVKRHNTVVVVLASDTTGIPNTPEKRAEIIRTIVQKAQKAGIGPEDIFADCVAESSAVNNQSATITLQAMNLVKKTLNLNQILGASNVSFGLPGRPFINAAFLALAVQGGLTAAIVDSAKMKPTLLAADLLLGRDNLARRYTAYFRRLRKQTE